jgi:hypothetical protein
VLDPQSRWWKYSCWSGGWSVRLQPCHLQRALVRIPPAKFFAVIFYRILVVLYNRRVGKNSKNRLDFLRFLGYWGFLWGVWFMFLIFQLQIPNLSMQFYVSTSKAFSCKISVILQIFDIFSSNFQIFSEELLSELKKTKSEYVV